MSDSKPGFFKRLFAFGRAKPAPDPASEPEIPVVVIAEIAPPLVELQRAKPARPLPVKQQSGPKAKVAAKPPVAKIPAPARKPEPEPAPPTRLKPVPAQKVPGKPAVNIEPAGEFVPQSPVVRPAHLGKLTVGGPKKQSVAQPEKPPEPAKTGWLARLAKGLSRSSQALTQSVAAVFVKRKLDEDTLQELEDVLIQADLGIETAMRVTSALSAQRYGKDVSDAEVREIMAVEIEKVLGPVAGALELDLDHTPHVILVIGVNGSGKTTTIGKLAHKLYKAGFSTLLVAGDTFRAAAIEQLKIWGERTQSPVIAREIGADAAGLAFDAWQRAKTDGFDVMLMDTAGRLQNKTELMAELEKIIRVLKKQDPAAPHTVLLTLDATTGQNALNQVEIFRQTAGVNGLVMTKLDGTARGGILVAISAKYKLPVYFIGVGETVDDLEPFEAADFARSIAGLGASG